MLSEFLVFILALIVVDFQVFRKPRHRGSAMVSQWADSARALRLFPVLLVVTLSAATSGQWACH